MAPAKRIFDIVLACFLLLFLWGLMLLIAFFVYLDSPGPVIFRQTRLGRHGKPFEILKFRKFPNDWGTQGPGVTVANDVRMTRVGRFLERTKLDELPQLWNIIKGEMSFVGPRPESLRYAALFEGKYERVLDYVPGIFGPNQIAYRNEALMYPADIDPETFYKTKLFPEKAQNDIDYFARSTLWRDVIWIVRGIASSIFSAVVWDQKTSSVMYALVLDLAATEIAWLAAHVIRLGSFGGVSGWAAYSTGAWLLPLILLPCFIAFRVYRNPIKFFSEADAYRLILGTLTGWAIGFFIIIGFVERFVSIVLGPLGFVIGVTLMMAPRLIYRSYNFQKSRGSAAQLADVPRVVIYGAGHRGIALARLLLEGFNRVHVLGFIDDSPHLRGRTIYGLRVLGAERDLDSIRAVTGLTDLWVMFNPDSIKAVRLKNWCAKSETRFEVLPQHTPFSRLMGAPMGPRAVDGALGELG